MYRSTFIILTLFTPSCATSLASGLNLSKEDHKCYASYCEELSNSSIWMYKGGHIERGFLDNNDVCPVVP